MIAGLIPHLLRHRALAVMVCIAVCCGGVWAMLHLKLEAYPDLSDPQVTVISLYPGHAAEEVEQQVTVRVERALQSVPRVIGRRSRSIFGLSVVDLIFEYDVEDHFARQAVLEKLRDASLPQGVEASLAPPTTPAGELYRYRVAGDGVDLLELRELQDWVISPRFLQVPGVGDAFAFGGLVKQYQVEVDPQALSRYGLTMNRIADAISANNQNAGGSLLTSGQQAMVVRGVGSIQNTSDIGNVVVASSKGVPVLVRNLGRVRVGAAPRNGIFGLNRMPDEVEGVVVMRRGENPSAVLTGVREAVEELNHGGLPAGVHLEPIYDRTELVQNTVHTVSRTLGEGLVLVFLVLLFFLGSLEGAVLTALAIPVALLFASGVMYFLGVSASLLSLGAIDFGIIVEGTLVMVELIVRRLRQSRSTQVHDVVLDAALTIQRPVFFSFLILAAAYLPLFTLERVEHRLFTPMAQIVCAALVGSALFSLLVVPVLATALFRNSRRGWENPLIGWLEGRYRATLAALIGRPWGVLAVTLAVLALAVPLAGKLGSEFLPHLDEGVIWIRAALPAGTSLETSAETAGRVRQTVMTFPEVSLVTSQTGRQESNTEPFGPNRNELLVALRPYSEWAGKKSKMQLTDEIARRLRAEFPGVTFSFTQPVIDMVTEAVTGSSADLAVILSGPDATVLREQAGQVLQMLRQVPGAADTAIEQEPEQAQVRVRVDREQVARYGINVKDVQDVIELAIGGRPVSEVYEADRVFDIVVRYLPEARSTLANIRNTMVPTPDGARIVLSQVADIRVEDGATSIARRENRRQISVRTNIDHRDQGSFVNEAQKLFAARIHLPQGYHVEWGGQFENLERARGRLAWILPLTVAVIFALLYWAFGSMLDGALVLINLPFSIVGGIVALWVRGIPFSVSAAVGFVSVFGVAVMNGLLCLVEVNRQRQQTGCTLREAVLKGASAQFRPRLMLVTLALLGILPATFATGIGSDVQRPMATVVLGGLVSTLILGFLVFPGLCYLAKRRSAESEL